MGGGWALESGYRPLSTTFGAAFIPSVANRPLPAIVRLAQGVLCRVWLGRRLRLRRGLA